MGAGRNGSKEGRNLLQDFISLKFRCIHFSKEFPSLVFILCLNAKLNNPPTPQSCHFVQEGLGSREGWSYPHTHNLSWGALIRLLEWGWLLSSALHSPSRKARPGFRLLESGKEFLSAGGYSRLD